MNGLLLLKRLELGRNIVDGGMPGVNEGVGNWPFICGYEYEGGVLLNCAKVVDGSGTADSRSALDVFKRFD